MKKRILLASSLTAALMAFLTVQMMGSSNMPESPFAPKYVLASHVTTSTPSEENPFEGLTSPPQDTIPLEDRKDDFLNNPSQNPFDLQDPAAVEQTVEYDPETGTTSLPKKLEVIISAHPVS